MDTDTALMLSLLLWILSIPAFFSAYSDWRFPRLPLALTGLGLGMFVYAIRNVPPPGYVIGDLPEVFVRVIGRLVN